MDVGGGRAVGLGSLHRIEKYFAAVGRDRPNRTSFNRGIELRGNSKFQWVARNDPLRACVTARGLRTRDLSTEAAKESATCHAPCAQAADSFCSGSGRFAAILDAFHRSRDAALRCTNVRKSSEFDAQTYTDRTARVRQGPSTLRATFLIDLGRFLKGQKFRFLHPKSRFSRFLASRRPVALSHD